MSRSNWKPVSEQLPPAQGEYEFKSVASVGKTIYHPKYGFEYDMHCEEALAILGGVGDSADKVTHWRKLQR